MQAGNGIGGASRDSYEGQRLADLEQELVRMRGQIEAAAVDEDLETCVRLWMRQAALPALIRQARAEPIRREVERLETELECLDAEVERVRRAPSPEVPEKLRGQQTPDMIRNRLLAGAVQRQRDAGKNLSAARRKLDLIEREGTELLVRSAE